ncbi:hypothetical protein GCM10025734_24980 [Kitasatospora paranensis]
MPRAPPNWRDMVFTPLPTANLVGGAENAAALEVPIVVAPMPMPTMNPAGSHSARKAAWSVSPKIISRPQRRIATRPTRVTPRGPPIRGASLPMFSAVMEATMAPGVMARPASISE